MRVHIYARRHLRDWSRFDVKRLRALARERVSARLAAGRLGRSPGAVRYKAMTLGIKFSSIKRKS